MRSYENWIGLKFSLSLHLLRNTWGASEPIQCTRSCSINTSLACWLCWYKWRLIAYGIFKVGSSCKYLIIVSENKYMSGVKCRGDAPFCNYCQNPSENKIFQVTQITTPKRGIWHWGSCFSIFVWCNMMFTKIYPIIYRVTDHCCYVLFVEIVENRTDSVQVEKI